MSAWSFLIFNAAAAIAEWIFVDRLGFYSLSSS
jgi:hypothetical protein